MAEWLLNVRGKHARYKELERILSDPLVFEDTAAYQRYAKERSRLAPLAEAFSNYLKMEEEIKKTETFLGDHNEEEEIRKLATEELPFLRERLRTCRDQLEELLISRDEVFEKDVIIEIRAGTGGLEAGLFAADLFRMYSKYAANAGWKTEILSTNTTDQGGFKEVIFSLSGERVYERMRFESGTHRVQRIPQTETSGRIHTSAVTVAVLPEADPVDIEISQEELRIDVYRSSGKGGQGVNTTDSAVRITHLPTGIVVTCQDERSQMKNKSKAMRVLRTRLLEKASKDQAQKRSSDRKQQVGTGDRSEKIRTYNFPERRLTEHRINLTIHRLEEFLEGSLDMVIDPLREEDKKIRLGTA